MDTQTDVRRRLMDCEHWPEETDSRLYPGHEERMAEHAARVEKEIEPLPRRNGGSSCRAAYKGQPVQAAGLSQEQILNLVDDHGLCEFVDDAISVHAFRIRYRISREPGLVRRFCLAIAATADEKINECAELNEWRRSLAITALKRNKIIT